MRKEIKDLVLFLPDNRDTALLDVSVSGDELQKMQNLVLKYFLTPTYCRVRGIPEDFMLVAHSVGNDVSTPSATVSRRTLLMSTQESMVYLVSATAVARKFFESHGISFRGTEYEAPEKFPVSEMLTPVPYTQTWTDKVTREEHKYEGVMDAADGSDAPVHIEVSDPAKIKKDGLGGYCAGPGSLGNVD
jgi:hypothetical protein